VIALERDRDLVPILRASLGGAGNVEVVEGNALMVDAGALRGDGEGPLCVAGNLPYHIASQIIFRLLDQRAHVKSMVLMLQKEMAQRAAAEPGTRESGVLSVLCRVHSEPRILFDVGPGAFRPAPKVVSSVVRFDIRPSPLVDPVLEPAFRRVVKAAFGQRRKTLRNALRPLFGGSPGFESALDAAGIDGGRRGETLAIGEFVRLAELLQATEAQ
jgi:16S rRNA (adenine1518-N6/adenine1519-N6)-dimethyltransferase